MSMVDPNDKLAELLGRYGYGDSPGVASAPGVINLPFALWQYAQRWRLPNNPEAILAHLQLPRCGCPDNVLAAAPGGELCRWEKPLVKVWPGVAPTAMRPADWVDTWAEALATWAAACGLRLAIVGTRAEADIWAAVERIDGPGSILAQSEVACGHGDRPLRQWYDSAEDWTRRPRRLRTIVHEVGHALGLGHSTDPASVMYPRILDDRAGLGGDDVPAMVARYGPPAVPTPTPNPTPTPPPPGPVPDGIRGTVTLTLGGVRHRVTIEPFV